MAFATSTKVLVTGGYDYNLFAGDLDHGDHEDHAVDVDESEVWNPYVGKSIHTIHASSLLEQRELFVRNSLY